LGRGREKEKGKGARPAEAFWARREGKKKREGVCWLG